MTASQQEDKMAMVNRDNDEDLYGDDEEFYRETVYNEEYYLEQEQELIRQSNLELELERLEDENMREMREEGLLRPTLVKPGENDSEESEPTSEGSSDDLADLPF
jgi:hypothetical protein